MEGDVRIRLTQGACVMAVLALGAAVSGCGGNATSSADAVATPKATVAFSDGRYVPARVRIEVGSRVTFVNRDLQPNTAETDGVDFFEYDRAKLDRQNRFDVHTVQQGEAESVEFDTPGTYRFHSSLNRDMDGVIEVVPRSD
jgi:plastocyanin